MSRILWAVLSAVLLAGMALASFDALACRRIPPRPMLAYAELAKTSDIVAIVRIERIRPMGAEDEARLQELIKDPPMDVPFRYPAESAESIVVRVLKGELAGHALVRNGITSCDIVFREGQDYLLFARASAESPELEPVYGTIEMTQGPASQLALAETESSLTPSNSKQP